jgi:hypothetical protein
MERLGWLVGLVVLAVVPVLAIWISLGRRPGSGRPRPRRASHLPRTLVELEAQARVAGADQCTTQPAQDPPALGTDWEAEQRRVLKTYGIGN